MAINVVDARVNPALEIESMGFKDNANTDICSTEKNDSEHQIDANTEIKIKTFDEDDPEKQEMLDHIQKCPAIFQSQQIGDPELTIAEKRKICESLLQKNPVNFLAKFGNFLQEEHLNYFLKKYNDSYEVDFYVKHFKNFLSEHNRKIIKRNRRFEAMRKLEAEGEYFSEAEMEKRAPVLYHEMVGQYLNKKEKLKKNREAQKNSIPTFSKFLSDKIEREELDQLVKNEYRKYKNFEENETSSEDEFSNQIPKERWGEDWEEVDQTKKTNKQKQHKKQKVHLNKAEKILLHQEFTSIMKNEFLNGKDSDFDYSEVDFNPNYDSIELLARDKEEKYFDEETLDNSVCTDTGVEDY